ncbi:hypothetical protein AB7W42_23275, partial [Providencia rettgeri]
MNIKAMIMCNKTLTLECDTDKNEFWLDLSVSLGWVKFSRMKINSNMFLATELRQRAFRILCHVKLIITTLSHYQGALQN